MRRDLEKTFRRVVWVGDLPKLPDDRPVVLYANHHFFHDGYLLWWLSRWLGRPPLIWMAERDRFPFFGPAGALSFPADDARARLRTLRATARLLEREPERILLYFPEGTLSPPDAGVQPWLPDVFARLDRILPPHAWWPVALHVTWWGEDRPTALLTGGPLHDEATGREREQLTALLRTLRATDPDSDHHLLLDGTRSPAERWDFRALTPFFDDPASRAAD